MLIFGEMVHTLTNPKTPEQNGTRGKPESTRSVLKGRFNIHKSDDDKMLAFGWANVAITSDGEQVKDLQEDIVDPDVLENAAYNFVEFYREGGEMHE